METAIRLLIDAYFQGIYTGNVAQLQRVFHPDALLFGDIHGVPYRKRVAEYLEAVEARQSPQTLGEPFLMEVLSVEITGAMAVVSVSVPIFGFQYRDYLSLIREGDTWLIVNKLFVDTRV